MGFILGLPKRVFNALGKAMVWTVRWFGGKLFSLCYFTWLLCVVTAEAAAAACAICYRLAKRDGWGGVKEELGKFRERQKGRFRGLLKHGWRASSFGGE